MLEKLLNSSGVTYMSQARDPGDGGEVAGGSIPGQGIRAVINDEHSPQIDELLERSSRLAITNEILNGNTNDHKSRLRDAMSLAIELSNIDDPDVLEQFPEHLTGMGLRDPANNGFFNLLNHCSKLGITENDFIQLVESSAMLPDQQEQALYMFYGDAIQLAQDDQSRVTFEDSALDLLITSLKQPTHEDPLETLLASGLPSLLFAEGSNQATRLDRVRNELGDQTYKVIYGAIEVPSDTALQSSRLLEQKEQILDQLRQRKGSYDAIVIRKNDQEVLLSYNLSSPDPDSEEFIDVQNLVSQGIEDMFLVEDSVEKTKRGGLPLVLADSERVISIEAKPGTEKVLLEGVDMKEQERNLSDALIINIQVEDIL